MRGRLDSPIGARFFAPRFVFVELFKHTERLLRATGRTEEKLLDALYALVSCLEFTDESAIPIGVWLEAHRLCAPTDPIDTPYLALALYHQLALYHHADLWTKDKELEEGLRARVFTRFYEP